MSPYVWCLLIGVVAGLRSMTPPAVTSLAAYLGWLPLENTALAFLGSGIAAAILGVLAIGELVADKLPRTPSRKTLAPFAWRILMGALCGAAIGGAHGAMVIGCLLGAIGGILGTLGGYEFRARLVRGIGGKDLPIALLEDAIAVGSACLIVSRAS